MSSSGMIDEVAELLRELQSTIGDEYRASDDPDDDTPGMQVTIATTDGVSWTYQTGDNSYSGSCYHHPYWGVMYLYRDMNAKQIREEAERGVNEMFEQLEGS